jgi:hypothetical protein
MESYIVRIYRRGGRRSRILVGTAEAAGTGRKMAFSNVDELWEILRRGRGRDPLVPQLPRRRRGKEVRNGTAVADHEESAEGCVRSIPLQDLEGRFR